MIDFSSFENASFVGKMLLLDEIEKSGDPAHIAPLVKLFDTAEDSLKSSMNDTLRSLLVKNPGRIAGLLDCKSMAPLKMAIQLSGQLKLSEAKWKLLGLARPGSPLLFDVLSALSGLADESLLELFRSEAKNSDPLIASLCVDQLGALKDVTSVSFLAKELSDSGGQDRYLNCSMVTASAISALSAIGTKEAVDVLLSHIHHKNPTVRRLVHEELLKQGKALAEPLSRFLTTGNDDEKIMALVLMGQLGVGKCADYILDAMDRGLLDEPNVRFAAFDAFGLIPSLKTMVKLLDSLDETDEMTLIAIATSLNRMANPGVCAKLGQALAEGEVKAKRIAKAVISSRGTELFKALFPSAPAGEILVSELCASKDPEIRQVFVEVLGSIEGESAAALVARLSGPVEEERKKRILAVDDSKSILTFYRAVLSDLGYDVATAENGKLALGVLSGDTAFDLIITDMNMPEMNGIEFTQKARENMLLAGLPIVMATTESDKSQIELADKAGVSGYLVKPITPVSLKAMLDGHLK